MEEEFKKQISSDQTGRFPYRSFKGNQYVMIIPRSDSNAILYQPVRNKEIRSNVKAWTEAVQRLAKCGIKPKHQMLDNEVSAEWKEAIEEAETTYQLAPPDGHSKDAEKTVQVGKDHLISILCGTCKNFRCNFGIGYYHMPRQPFMLRPARVSPNVSAYAYMHGQHDFNVHPLAPLGMEAEMHLKPDARETWQEHSASGFNVGTLQML